MSTTQRTEATVRAETSAGIDRVAAADRAAAILDALENDGRYCSNCFRKYREYDRPPEGCYPECVVGFSYATEHGIRGPTNTTRLVPTADGAKEVVDGTAQGIICECGVGNHDMRRRPVKRWKGIGHARRLSDAIHDLAAEHSHEAKKSARRAENARRKAVVAGQRAREEEVDAEPYIRRAHEHGRAAREHTDARVYHTATAGEWEHDRDALTAAYERFKEAGFSDEYQFRRALIETFENTTR